MEINVNNTGKFLTSIEEWPRNLESLSYYPKLIQLIFELINDKGVAKIKSIGLNPDRVEHLKIEVGKVLEMLLENVEMPIEIPILLKPFKSEVRQEMLILEDGHELNFNNDIFVEQAFPEFNLETSQVIITPNRFPVILDHELLVIIDFLNSQILPSIFSTKFLELIKNNCNENVIMFNMCLSNSIANLHAQVSKDEQPLTEEEVRLKYPGEELIFYDLNNKEGQKDFLEIWKFINLKQIPASSLVTKEGKVVIFTQQFQGQFITKKILNYDQLSPEEQDTEAYIRILFTILKVGGFELHKWLKNQQMINKSNLAPDIITPELAVDWLTNVVQPLTKNRIEQMQGLPNENVLDLINSESFDTKNLKLMIQDLERRQKELLENIN